ncbi:MAG: cytidylate kinase-like family protein, partial [Paludibacter sp.]|nr:cytidylate kinase-like family protein [Paludibacter sp.]
AALISVVKELADTKAIVIRGRGSQFILKDHPETVHILTVAPLEVRVKRTATTMKIDEDSALKVVSRSDSSHREFIKRYFKADLEDPINYDLVLNTKALSYDSAASLSINVVSLKNKQ